jgi:hypothetical protein
MAELSPAAQVILDAASEVYWNWTDMSPASSQTIVAAALRAAADQMSSHHSKSFLYSIADVLKLQTIADELETQ